MTQLHERLKAGESNLTLFGSEHAKFVFSVKIDFGNLDDALRNLVFYLQAFQWSSLCDGSRCELGDNDLEVVKAFMKTQQELKFPGDTPCCSQLDEMKVASMLFALLSPEGDQLGNSSLKRIVKLLSSKNSSISVCRMSTLRISGQLSRC